MLFNKKSDMSERFNSAGEFADKPLDLQIIRNLINVFSSASEEKEILSELINTATRLTKAKTGSVILFDPANMNSAKTLIHSEDHTEDLLDHKLNLLLSGWVLVHKERLLTDDLITMFDRKYTKDHYSEISSAMSIPIQTQGKTIGVINLIKTGKHQKFNSWHISLTELLAALCVHYILSNRMQEKLFNETERLRKEAQRIYTYEGLIGKSSKMNDVYKLLEKIIPTDGRVIIEGESGTGKELVARILHYNGPRKEKPFVAVDCGVLPENLIESELFGHIKGAFTGAGTDKKGLFEEADGGTIFLDEIMNMSLDMQGKLLRVIQEHEFRPVGSTDLKKVNVRLIVAASSGFLAKVEKHEFREDLYYRLNVMKITLPPLRDRKGDIPLLAHHFLKRISQEYNKKIEQFDISALTALEDYNWPGNIRELENVIERTVILADANQGRINYELLPEEVRLNVNKGATLDISGSGIEQIKANRNLVEKTALTELLEKNKWNQSATARDLGIHESSLRYKMKQLHIQKPAN